MSRHKPHACANCPLFGDGEGYVEDVLDEEAEVLVIGLCPTTYEATKGQPQVGPTVEDYKREYERYAGSTKMSYANVIRCRAQRGVKLPKGAKLAAGVKFCRQYDRIPRGTKLVVLQGSDVVAALRPDIKAPLKWRGFQLPEGLEEDLGGSDNSL